MAKIGGKGAWAATAGVALLLAFAFVPALSGAASAAPVTSATTDPANQWAYGGEGWSNNTVIVGNATITWDGMFGWTVIFTVTQTAPGIWMIEEQRTVGVTITATFTNPAYHGTYNFHAQAVDVAFANVTNQSTVYVNGLPVPALGILNASLTENAALAESFSVTAGSHTASASLDVTGSASGTVSFSPSLGLIPLDLTGVDQWNSSAIATAAAHWNLAWSWNYQEFNGTTGSGSNSKSGSLSGSAPVNLTGFKVVIAHPFDDHQARIGVLLVLQGPFDVYDGFILVPHDFDLFGGATHGYDSLALGSAAISTETLALSPGPGGLAVTAADQTFGSTATAVTAQANGLPGASPAATSSPGATVQGQPMSVAQAQSENQQLVGGGASAAANGMSAVLLAVVVALVVAAVVGTVGVIEWRSYAKRRSRGGLVGGYGERWPGGVPPAAANPPSPPGPGSPMSGPETVEDLNRRL
jgi:hypothetical protein